MCLYLKERTNLFTDRLRVLHVAPEECLWRGFRQMENLTCVSIDLQMPSAMARMDVTNLAFAGASFDVVLCSHVLEHIVDDRRAMREMFRVLKPGGWAILEVPIDQRRERTFEDPTVCSADERLRVFGQRDHVRIYGRDYPARLQDAGFAVQVHAYARELPAEVRREFGLTQHEDIFHCGKPTLAEARKRSAAPATRSDSKRAGGLAPSYSATLGNADDSRACDMVREEIVSLIGEGNRIVDLASGDGALCRLIKRHHPRALVTGVGVSPQRVSPHLPSDGEACIEYVVGGRALPLSLRSDYDVVVFCNTVDGLHEIGSAIGDGAGLLRPGGLLVVAYALATGRPHDEGSRCGRHADLFRLLAPHGRSVTVVQFDAPATAWALGYVAKTATAAVERSTASEVQVLRSRVSALERELGAQVRAIQLLGDTVDRVARNARRN